MADARPLDGETFVPQGSTALLDAIGRTINDTGKRLERMAEDQRPEKVIFVVLTDGEENASREFSAEKVNDMITHQRDAYKWEFVFLGANQDAITTASRLGIQPQNALTYAANSVGTKQAYRSLSANMLKMRSGATSDMGFTDEDREEQEKAGAWQSK